MIGENTDTAYQKDHPLLTVKHCDGGMMIWASFAFTDLGALQLLSQQ